MWKVLLIALPLGGCLTTDDMVIFDRYPTRSEIDARNAEIVCKQAARTLVQVARCEVRR